MAGPHGYKRINSDGSRNVWCPQCRNYICTINGMSTINTAICVLCQLQNDGIDITEEQERELRTVRVGEYTISQNAAYPELPVDPMTQATPNQVDANVGRIGYFLKALVKNMRAAVEATKETVATSTKVAKEKKRSRLFDQPLDPD